MEPIQNDCYYEFDGYSNFIYDYCHSILNHEKIDQVKWANYYEFDILKINTKKLEQEPILKKIHQKFPIKFMAITKINPDTCFVWHMDGKRGVAINMLIHANPNSKTLFGIGGKYYSEEEINCDDIRTESNGTVDPKSVVIKFIELKYKPKKFYLFNTRILHSVLNFTENRYLFTIEFEQDKTELSYKDIFEWLKTENFLKDLDKPTPSW